MSGTPEGGAIIDLPNVTVRGAAELLTKRTGRRFVIEPRAMPTALCERFHLRLMGGDLSLIVDILTASLDGTRIQLTPSGSDYLLSLRDPARVDPECRLEAHAWRELILRHVRRERPNQYLVARTGLEFFLVSSLLWSETPFESDPRGQRLALERRWSPTDELVRFYEGIGAQPGDLILDVNGVSVSYENIERLRVSMRSAREIVVRLERQGALVQLRYRIVDQLPR